VTLKTNIGLAGQYCIQIWQFLLFWITRNGIWCIVIAFVACFVYQQSFSSTDIYRAVNPASQDKGIIGHELDEMSSILIMKLLSGFAELLAFFVNQYRWSNFSSVQLLQYSHICGLHQSKQWVMSNGTELNVRHIITVQRNRMSSEIVQAFSIVLQG